MIYTDDQGRAFNLETTSGAGFTRAAYYREQLPMTDKAVDNGVYLRKLNHTETIAALASDVVSHYLKSNQPEQAIAVADVMSCVLLDKPGHLAANIKSDFKGFDCPDKFVVGYGMDMAHQFRELPFVGNVVTG